MNIPTIAFNSTLIKSTRFIRKNRGKLRVGLTFDLQEEYLARKLQP